jgi:hypothetical protein
LQWFWKSVALPNASDCRVTEAGFLVVTGQCSAGVRHDSAARPTEVDRGPSKQIQRRRFALGR